MSDGKLGVENIKDILRVVFSIIRKAKERLADGVQFVDILEIAKWGVSDTEFRDEIKEAIKDIDQVFAEIMDLKISEAIDLFKFAKDEIRSTGIDFSQIVVLLKYFPFLEKIIKKIFY